MSKYSVPRYVEGKTVLFNGSFKQFLIWTPFLILGILLFFSLSGKLKIVLPTIIIGLGYVLSTMKIDRETYWELLMLQIKYWTQRKTLYWERSEITNEFNREYSVMGCGQRNSGIQKQ